ncbi:MAG: hypothetical protein ABII09_03815 [Planctomycetota bacterium]
MIQKNSDNQPDDEELFEERTEEEILATIDELTDKVWYNRHQVAKEQIEAGLEDVDPGIWKQALAKAKEFEDKYGLENLGPYDDFEWGMLSGKLSALRWLIGFEWDMLDT